MNSFKQALIQAKGSPRQTVALGILGALLIQMARHIPYLSAFTLGFGLLLFQEFAKQIINHGTWPPSLRLVRTHLLGFISISLILLPTVVLAGSAIGLLQSPQSPLVTASIALVLFTTSIYFYFVLTHSLQLHMTRKVSLAKAIDMTALASLRNFRLYGTLSFYMSVLMLISALTWGAGFIITLPLLFYVDHFLYLEIETQDLISRVPQ